MSKKNIFPILFKLERVVNGYILTPQNEKKEALTHDIEKRLGQFFHIDMLPDDDPIEFRIDAITDKPNKEMANIQTDSLMESKLLYVKFFDTDRNTFLILQNNGNYEIIGPKVEEAKKILDLPTLEIGGIELIRLPQGKESGKLLHQLGRIRLVDVSNEQIEEWAKTRAL